MGSKKVEEKLQTLIHAFYEQKELSAKDIQNLLVCNRASTYNYIERLKERGFELESTTRNKTAYTHLRRSVCSSCLLPTDIQGNFTKIQCYPEPPAQTRHCEIAKRSLFPAR